MINHSLYDNRMKPFSIEIVSMKLVWCYYWNMTSVNRPSTLRKAPFVLKTITSFKLLPDGILIYFGASNAVIALQTSYTHRFLENTKKVASCSVI